MEIPNVCACVHISFDYMSSFSLRIFTSLMLLLLSLCFFFRPPISICSILAFKIDANTLMLGNMVVSIVLLLIKISLCKKAFFHNFMEIRCSCCCFALFELTRSGSLHWHGRYRSVLACELRSSLAVRSLCIFLFMNVCRDLTAAKTTTAATVEAMMVILLSRVRALFNSNRVSKKYQKEAHTFYMYWLEYIA